MTRSTRLLTAVLALALVVPPAAAELCTIDAVPAATLLVPYFEVNLTKKLKVNTVLSIQNTTFLATVARVTLWTDWAVPTFAFDVFLTGYDTQKIDLAEVFDGNLPQTAHAFNDPNDTISPHGDNPSWDSQPDSSDGSRFSGCDTVLPPGRLSSALRDRLRTSHSGGDIGRGCVGASYGDNFARGYVTVDNVTDCSLLLPGDPGYFGSGGIASDVNQLRGEFYLTERTGKGMGVSQAVAIEAASTGGSGYTFYGSFVDGNGSDRREPLATTWAARWPDNLPFGRSQRTVQTDLLIWRDPTYNGLGMAWDCATGPPWLPLDHTQIVAFDEKVAATEYCRDGAENLPCAGLATQRVSLGSGDWKPNVGRGWSYLNLNGGFTGTGAVDFGGLSQSYVAMLMSVQRLRANTPGTALSSACGP